MIWFWLIIKIRICMHLGYCVCVFDLPLDYFANTIWLYAVMSFWHKLICVGFPSKLMQQHGLCMITNLSLAFILRKSFWHLHWKNRLCFWQLLITWLPKESKCGAESRESPRLYSSLMFSWIKTIFLTPVTVLLRHWYFGENNYSGIHQNNVFLGQLIGKENRNHRECKSSGKSTQRTGSMFVQLTILPAEPARAYQTGFCQRNQISTCTSIKALIFSGIYAVGMIYKGFSLCMYAFKSLHGVKHHDRRFAVTMSDVQDLSQQSLEWYTCYWCACSHVCVTTCSPQLLDHCVYRCVLNYHYTIQSHYIRSGQFLCPHYLEDEKGTVELIPESMQHFSLNVCQTLILKVNVLLKNIEVDLVNIHRVLSEGDEFSDRGFRAPISASTQHYSSTPISSTVLCMHGHL